MFCGMLVGVFRLQKEVMGFIHCGKQIVSSKSFQRGLTNDWDGFEESAKENRGVLGWSYQEALTTPRPGE